MLKLQTHTGAENRKEEEEVSSAENIDVGLKAQEEEEQNDEYKYEEEEEGANNYLVAREGIFFILVVGLVVLI